MTNPYESGVLLRQYLDFHYRGETPDYLPHHPLPPGVLAYPRRCADKLTRAATRFDRALDLGCAVGGGTFVLSRSFQEVVGIDFARRFIDAAQMLAREGLFRSSEDTWHLPSEVRKCVPQFLQGDACALPNSPGRFDAILLANLLCRLPDPAACLQGLRKLTAPGSVILITTPCSWDDGYTPPEKQLRPTLEGLHQLLDPWCDCLEVTEMPFVLRDHVRRAQFTVAQASTWRVRL